MKTEILDAEDIVQTRIRGESVRSLPSVIDAR
jgi:hypothetical protein